MGEVIPFHETYTMFTRGGAFHFDSPLDHVVHEVLCFFVFGVLVVEDDGCNIPLAGI